MTIVIATYNRASLLQATLGRLRHQAYEPGDEVTVVDNGSPDSTADVIARAATDFPVLRSLQEPIAGKGPALNAGIAAARGSVLALTDDDVIVVANWIPTIRDTFRNPSIDLVGGRVDPQWEEPAPAWLQVERNGRYGPMSSHWLCSITARGSRLAVGRRSAPTWRYVAQPSRRLADSFRNSLVEAAHRSVRRTTNSACA